MEEDQNKQEPEPEGYNDECDESEGISRLYFDAVTEAVNVNIEFMNKYLMKARQSEDLGEKMGILGVITMVAKFARELTRG
jgi:hypothetical protein